MIAGIGTDLVEIYRIEEMILRGRHLSRIFTTTELAYAKDNATTLAGNFAVKEAVSKVFGTGFFGVEPYEIEVLRNESGAPYVKLYGKAKEIAKDKQVSRIHVSITNTREFAQAFAIGNAYEICIKESGDAKRSIMRRFMNRNSGTCIDGKSI